MNNESKRTDGNDYGSRQCVVRASLCGLALWVAACSASDQPKTDQPTTPVVDADLPDLPDALSAPDQDSGGSHPEESCAADYLRDPSDDRMSNEPVEWASSTGEIDLFLPHEVSDWMTKRLWQ